MSDRKQVVAESGELLDVPAWRVAMCHRWTHGPGPALWRSPDRTAADFSDVYTCGSVWHCPVCSAKITSGRRAELLAAIAAWRDRGGEVYLATRTHSHEKRERPLPEQLKALAGALSRAKGTRRALAVAARAGVIGSIRALEVTHGEMNGWHPHTHELIFARPGELARLVSLRVGWIRTLIKRGLAGMRDGMTRAERAEQLRHLRRHAMQVQPGEFASDYVAKFGLEPATEQGGHWGPASELTRGHQKVGALGGQRLSGRTPFELLRLYVEGDKRAGMLFRDYALVFNGRAQLYWSPRLRGELVELCRAQHEECYFAGAVDLSRVWRTRAETIGRDDSDEALAARRVQACTEFVARLDGADWKVVLRTNSRHDLLIAAQLDGAEGVAALLVRLRGERATHQEEFRADWRRFDRGRLAA